MYHSLRPDAMKTGVAGGVPVDPEIRDKGSRIKKNGAVSGPAMVGIQDVK